MNSVGLKQGGAVPEQIKIVDKTYLVSSAGRLQPGVETEDSAKTPRSTGKSREGTADKNRFAAVI